MQTNLLAPVLVTLTVDSIRSLRNKSLYRPTHCFTMILSTLIHKALFLTIVVTAYSLVSVICPSLSSRITLYIFILSLFFILLTLYYINVLYVMVRYCITILLFYILLPCGISI